MSTTLKALFEMLEREKWSIKCICVLIAYYFSWNRGKNNVIFVTKQVQTKKVLFMRTDKITFNIFILIAINMFMFTGKAQNSYNAKQLEMLLNKTWCEIDSDNGTKLNSELFFDKEGLVLCFTHEDNAKQVVPEWELCKFNISDDNITITQNENKTENFNIVKLSDEALVLSSKGVEKSIRMFKTQSTLDNELLSSPNNTTFDYLTAKQWQIVKPPKYLTKWHRWYFADGKWFLVDFRYNKNRDKWETIVEIRDYYLAEYADHNFSRGQLSKKQKNGNFVNYYIEHKHQGKHNKYNLSSILPKIQSKSFQIIYSSDGYLLLESVPIDYQNDNIYNNGETYKYLLRSY